MLNKFEPSVLACLVTRTYLHIKETILRLSSRFLRLKIYGFPKIVQSIQRNVSMEIFKWSVGGEIIARSEHHPDGLIYYNSRLAYRGYTLFSGDEDKAFLIDMKGNVVHQWQSESGISNPELLPSGNLICLGTVSYTHLTLPTTPYV